MALAILLGLLFLLIILMIFPERIIFQPPHWQGMPEKPMLLDAGSEKIAVLYYPGDSYVILYSHGNGEDLSSVRHTLQEYHKRGFAVIGYDYEGYGASTGKPSVQGACRNIEAVYRFLTETENISADRILVTGYSVGSGPSCWLASRYPIAGLILEAPFASAFQVILPIAGLPGDRFLNWQHIRDCKAPILIFHGEKDRVIPVRNGKKLFAAAPEPKKLILIPEAGHYDLKECLGEKYWPAYQEFTDALKK